VRTVVGWFFVTVGAACLLAGAAVAALLGPDDRARSDPQPLDTRSSVLVTAAGLLSWSGPTVQVEATLPDDRPVFVGLGNEVDVSDYSRRVDALVVEAIELPFVLDAVEVDAGRSRPVSPDRLDWWLASVQGDGAATLGVQLPSAPSQLVVAALDRGDLRGLEVTAAYELDGGFGVGVGVAVLGVGLVLFGVITRRRRPDDGGRRRRRRDNDPVIGDAGSAQPGQGSSGRSPAPGHRAVRLAEGVVAGLALVGLTAGCTVPLPVDEQPVKTAVAQDDADEVVARWAERRAEAVRTLDPAPLAEVEAGATLAVEEGALAVARRLITPGSQETDQDLRLRRVVAPRLSSYPLWFIAVVDDGQRELAKVQVYRRAQAAGPWQLVSTTEVLPSTQLPDVALDDTGAFEPVDPADAKGLPAAPQEIADGYAALLDDLEARGDELVLVDSFVEQMRAVATNLDSLDGVRLRQSWRAQPVRWVARTSDGGALVFATMARDDRYRITSGTAAAWPEGSAQSAFLAGRGDTSAVLRFRHQVLLYVPPTGGGQARALGQYGGVVSTTGR